VKRDPTERPTFEEVLQAPLKDYQHRETSGDTDIHFGQFCALPLSRQLLPDGTPVELGGRAFDLFMVLVAAKGSVVGKEEIMRRVSPSTVVGEGNLRVQMAGLRKAFGAYSDVKQFRAGLYLHDRNHELARNGATRTVDRPP
jgi:DNA-binding response OmpR family regulator